jgi:hypothetical protein
VYIYMYIYINFTTQPHFNTSTFYVHNFRTLNCVHQILNSNHLYQSIYWYTKRDFKRKIIWALIYISMYYRILAYLSTILTYLSTEKKMLDFMLHIFHSTVRWLLHSCIICPHHTEESHMSCRNMPLVDIE